MDTLRLGLEWFLNPDHAPLLIAREMGWWEDAALQIEVIEPEEHLDAIDAIADGEMDLAITEPLHLVEDRAQEHDVIGFGRFLHTNGGVMYLENSGIKRPTDLNGIRLQYPGAPGPGGKAIIKTMIEADGGTFQEDEVVPVNNGFYHTDALADDLADAATLAFYNFELVEANHLGLNAHFFALKDWSIPDFCQLIFITSPKLLDGKADAIHRFMRVIKQGIDFLYQHPDEARSIYFSRDETPDADELSVATFDATLPCFTYDFSMSRAYYKALENWMYREKLISQRPGADGYWTNTFAFPH